MFLFWIGYIAIAFFSFFPLAKAVYTSFQSDGVDGGLELTVSVFFGMVLAAVWPLSLLFLTFMMLFKKYGINVEETDTSK